MENILVVKLSAIGDVIHALPVSYAIKEQYPNAHLTWVVEPTAYAILEDNPYIDELILFEKAKFRSIGGFRRAVRRGTAPRHGEHARRRTSCQSSRTWGARSGTYRRALSRCGACAWLHST